jgi:alpha-tubulin suppressor-like RCC1 family protein
VFTGAYYSVAIKKDGSLWVWGCNLSGQLGDNTKISKNSPVRIGADNDWAVLAAGSSHTLAIKNDGSLWAWGGGYLGDGADKDSPIPLRIGTENDWAMVSAGFSHSLAIKKDGSLWSWGANYIGQLGSGKASNIFEFPHFSPPWNG